MSMIIQFDNVSLSYSTGFQALNNISFEVADGEMIFLTGHSGAGKTTVLKLLMMLFQKQQLV